MLESIYLVGLKFINMLKPYSFLFLLSFSLLSINLADAQSSNEDALFIKKIYNQILNDGDCYDWLHQLSTVYGGRLAGSKNADRAVLFTKSIMDTIGFDKVYLQECIVPHWERGAPEQVDAHFNGQIKQLRATALGNSPGGKAKAEVIEVFSLDEVKKLGRNAIEGKIVFYNRPMNPSQIRTFNAYGGAVDQRGTGPAIASRFGAVATVVRSMTTMTDGVPHTGVTIFGEDKPTPAAAISTLDADWLSAQLKKGKVEISLETHGQLLPDVISHNVIGEIKGSTYPDKIILVGGHLDSWDIGGGAHDDGAGCVHSMQVLRTMRKLNYQPKHTIRCVLFMNEENGLGGGKAYAEASNKNQEYHMAALESDSGGFTPRGFSVDAENDVFAPRFKMMTEWLPLLEPYGLSLTKGGSGADINPLKGQKGMLIGFRPDSQRYFDFHHTSEDTIDAVNQRELELGAASITSLIYLIDKYGL